MIIENHIISFIFIFVLIIQLPNQADTMSAAVAEKFSMALHLTAHSWKLVLDKRLKSLGMSRAVWSALAAVARSETAPTQIELAQQLGLEGASLVALID